MTLVRAYKTEKGVRVELSEMTYFLSNKIEKEPSRVIGRLVSAKERKNIGLK